MRVAGSHTSANCRKVVVVVVVVFYYSVGVNVYVYEGEGHVPMMQNRNGRQSKRQRVGVVGDETGRAGEQQRLGRGSGGGTGVVVTMQWRVASAKP